MSMNDELDEILESRGQKNGEYADMAAAIQSLKRHVRACFGDSYITALSPVERESTDMILHKMGRIIVGDENEVDHWIDIAGYATLVADRIRPDSFRADHNAGRLEPLLIGGVYGLVSGHSMRNAEPVMSEALFARLRELARYLALALAGPNSKDRWLQLANSATLVADNLKQRTL